MRERGFGPLARAARWLLVLGALCYSSWPLAFVVPTGLGQVSAMTSDYEASGHPWAWLFRVLDVLSGALIAVGGAIGVVVLRRAGASLPMQLAMFATAFRGFATVVTGSVSTNCTYAGDQCRRRHENGVHGPWRDVVHHLLSGWSGAGITLCVLGLAVGFRMRSLTPACRVVTPILLVALLVHELNVLHLLWSRSAQGIPQRVSEAAETALFLALAVDVGGIATRRVPRGRRRSGGRDLRELSS